MKPNPYQTLGKFPVGISSSCIVYTERSFNRRATKHKWAVRYGHKNHVLQNNHSMLGKYKCYTKPPVLLKNHVKAYFQPLIKTLDAITLHATIFYPSARFIYTGIWGKALQAYPTLVDVTSTLFHEC